MLQNSSILKKAPLILHLVVDGDIFVQKIMIQKNENAAG